MYNLAGQMKRLLVISVLVLSWHLGFAQEASKWAIYIDLETSSIDNTSNFYLVKHAKQNQKRFSIAPFKVLKKLDDDHSIVQADELQLSSYEYWKVNNDWKLNIDPSRSSTTLTIIGSEEFDPASVNVISSYGNVYLIRSSVDQIDVLKSYPEVLSISNNIPYAQTEARVIDMNLNPSRINRVQHEFPMLNGSTELVSIQENKYREDDIDLLGRNVVTGLESEEFDNHANEMATIIAGSGVSFITGKGVLSEVGITSSRFNPVLPREDSYYQNNGILTQNHSYGTRQDPNYEAQALAFDLSSYNNQSLMHVFSSGNEGLVSSISGTYAGIEGYANLTGDVKMAKNSLVVGSVDTLGNAVSFVSRGPAYDGRVKPEVVAYSVVGSSNSAALVSGVSVILQQAYREQYGGAMPSALVKSLLINSAKDAGDPGLDFITGYGSVNAYRSLQSLQEGRFFSGEVTSGSVESFDLILPPNALNLKVTLVWTDPPANVGDAKALVNDLDLRLKNSLNIVTNPWVLNESPDIQSLSSSAIRGVDRLNNVEQVTIDNPETDYTIEVEGFDVGVPQPFYVSYQYDLEDSFEWDFPTGSDNMPYNGESGSYFRWTSTYSGMAELSYSIDDGLTWSTLDDAIDLEKGYWRWSSPPLSGDSAIARMEIDGAVYETDLFTLSAPLNASVGFNCADSLLLKWPPVQNASTYTVYSLIGSQLEELMTTSDTFSVIDNKSSLTDNRFSIQPNLPNGQQLLPTPTFDYTLQGVECYVISFFQSIALDTGIYLNLDLGTIYGIEEIIFERSNGIAFEEIGSIVSPGNEMIRYLDSQPEQGYNEHQAIIRFENGEVVTISAGTSFYLTEVPIRLYPNPVASGEYINILTKEFEERQPLFELLDPEGVVLISYILLSSQDFIQLPLIDPGVYFYRLTADGNTFKGRVLVR